MREKLLENIQAALREANDTDNHNLNGDEGPIFWNTQALHDIAKHVEPFKQFSPEELKHIQMGLELLQTMAEEFEKPCQDLLEELNLTLES